MIHHVSVGTNDLARSKRFYDAVLPILGLKLMAADDGGLGYGSGTFHFSVQIPIDGSPASVGNGSHIAMPRKIATWLTVSTLPHLSTAAATTEVPD